MSQQSDVRIQAKLGEAVVAEGAARVQWRAYDVSYEMDTPYPAEALIAEFGRKLKALGWRELHEDILNPGLPTSHASGWSNFLDKRSRPERRVYQWMGQWAHQTGDVIVIGLAYKANGSDLHSAPTGALSVGARLLTVDILKRLGLKPPIGN